MMLPDSTPITRSVGSRASSSRVNLRESIRPSTVLSSCGMSAWRVPTAIPGPASALAQLSGRRRRFLVPVWRR